MRKWFLSCSKLVLSSERPITCWWSRTMSSIVLLLQAPSSTMLSTKYWWMRRASVSLRIPNNKWDLQIACQPSNFRQLSISQPVLHLHYNQATRSVLIRIAYYMGMLSSNLPQVYSNKALKRCRTSLSHLPLGRFNTTPTVQDSRSTTTLSQVFLSPLQLRITDREILKMMALGTLTLSTLEEVRNPDLLHEIVSEPSSMDLV